MKLTRAQRLRANRSVHCVDLTDDVDYGGNFIIETEIIAAAGGGGIGEDVLENQSVSRPQHPQMNSTREREKEQLMTNPSGHILGISLDNACPFRIRSAGMPQSLATADIKKVICIFRWTQSIFAIFSKVCAISYLSMPLYISTSINWIIFE